jgi:hypothetical protein
MAESGPYGKKAPQAKHSSTGGVQTVAPQSLVLAATAGGTRGPGNPALVAQATMVAAQGASAAAMGGLAPLGAVGGVTAGMAAAATAGNPADQVKRNIQEIKLELKSLDDLAQRFGVGVFQSMSKAIAGTESFGKAIKGVVGSLGTTLGNDMISAGVAAILHPSRWAPDRPGGGGEGTPAAGGARGAAQAGLGGLADQAGKGLTSLLGKAGMAAGPAGMVAGAALAIGGTLLGGLFGGKN